MTTLACGNVDYEAEIIRGALRGVWPSLPVLLVASVAICAAAVVPIVVAPGVNPAAVVVAAITCGPFVAALAAVGNEIVEDGQSTIRTWWQALRRFWRFGIGSALVPAVPLVLLLAAVEVWRITGNPVVWPSFALSGICSLVTALGLMAALPLGVDRADLRGLVLWRASIALVAVAPVRFVAVASAACFGLWAATEVSASVLLLVPAPTAIVAVAATWTSAAAAAERSRPC